MQIRRMLYRYPFFIAAFILFLFEATKIARHEWGGDFWTQLVGVWSEPPIAVIGMNAGTLASYARPLQHMHFYEPNRQLIDLMERGFFRFLSDARVRGADLPIPTSRKAGQG